MIQPGTVILVITANLTKRPGPNWDWPGHSLYSSWTVGSPAIVLATLEESRNPDRHWYMMLDAEGVVGWICVADLLLSTYFKTLTR